MKTNKHGMRTALKEYLLSGKPVTGLESLLYFGVANFYTPISDLRKQGWLIKSQTIPYAAVIKRMQGQAVAKPAVNLPIKEIELTEWWISQ